MATGAQLEKYKQLLINLLPKGRLWDTKEQPILRTVLEGAATELCRLEDRVKDLLRESDPNQTVELLTDWEKLVGLPDECTPDGLTDAERRAQVIQKLTLVGELSKQFYESVALTLGFTVEVTDYHNFVAGSHAGDPLSNYFNRHFVAGSVAGTPLTEIGWRFYFNVDGPATVDDHFVAGSFAGDPLRFVANPLVQCTIRKLKPAHTGVTFTFNSVP